MRLFLFLLLGLPCMVRAGTVQDLSQNNASPEEIIQKLKMSETPTHPKAEVNNPVQVGRVVSLIRQNPDTPFYDFTIALSDDRVIKVSDTNHLGLKPGDGVILTGDSSFWKIKGKIVN